MHSSRMRTTRSSSRHGGGGLHPPASSPSTSPLGVGLEQIPINFPLGCGPGPDPPELSPWLWAWRPLNFSLGCGPGNLQGMLGYKPSHPPPRPAATHAGIPPAMHAAIAHPPVKRITDTCKNITFPQLRLRAVKKQEGSPVGMCTACSRQLYALQ